MLGTNRNRTQQLCRTYTHLQIDSTQSTNLGVISDVSYSNMWFRVKFRSLLVLCQTVVLEWDMFGNVLSLINGQGPWNDFYPGGPNRLSILWDGYVPKYLRTLRAIWGSKDEAQMFNLSIAKFSPKHIFNILTWQQSKQSLGTYLFENLEMAAG